MKTIQISKKLAAARSTVDAFPSRLKNETRQSWINRLANYVDSLAEAAKTETDPHGQKVISIQATRAALQVLAA